MIVEGTKLCQRVLFNHVSYIVTWEAQSSHSFLNCIKHPLWFLSLPLFLYPHSYLSSPLNLRSSHSHCYPHFLNIDYSALIINVIDHPHFLILSSCLCDKALISFPYISASLRAVLYNSNWVGMFTSQSTHVNSPYPFQDFVLLFTISFTYLRF